MQTPQQRAWRRQWDENTMLLRAGFSSQQILGFRRLDTFSKIRSSVLSLVQGGVLIAAVTALIMLLLRVA